MASENTLGVNRVVASISEKGGINMRLNPVDVVSLILVIVGALNWLLVGLFDFNLVNAIFGSVPVLEAAIYVIVGLAGLWLIYFLAFEYQRRTAL